MSGTPTPDAGPPGLIGPGLPRRLVEHDPAAVHEHDPVGPRRDLVHPVLDDDDAGALIAGEPAQRAEHFLRAHRVQVRQRLVEHEDARAHGQRGRDRRALLLARRTALRWTHGRIPAIPVTSRHHSTRAAISGCGSARFSGPNATSDCTV